MTTLGYALLALLAREPLTGYDLAQRMRHSTDFFWTARHSQIYPELARMEAAGLLIHEVIRQRERPDKKRYTMTEAGYAALRAWLIQPVGVAPRQVPLLGPQPGDHWRRLVRFRAVRAPGARSARRPYQAGGASRSAQRWRLHGEPRSRCS